MSGNKDMARRTMGGVLWVMLSVAAGAFGASAAVAATMRVQGSAIVVEADDGSERRGAAVVGSEFELSGLGALRIRAAVLDASARFPEDTWLYEAQLRAPGTTDFVDACAGAAGADRRMMIYSGYLDPTLRYVADPTRFSISCVSGVEAKCLRWGYQPWRSAPIGGTSLAPYFEACVRLARADYCGDGQATTREGTAIDVYDRVGVMERTPNLHDFDFEAGWSPAGATCAHHARIAEHLDLADLPVQCPRLHDAPIAEACDEATAEARGAILFTRSVIRDGARR